jgi:pyruvate dehydrogenase E1 component beta subunit
MRRITMRELKYVEAIRAGLEAELEADPRVILIGEEVGKLGGVYTATLGLQERFGVTRVLDAPIAEAGFVGWAIGAATEGLRPVVEIMFMDFATLIMDQIVNGAAKLRYMSGGQYSVPLVIRMPAGGGTDHGPQHSQSLETWFAHVPGLIVAMPATSSDAYWMLRAAIQLDDPVIFVENKYLYFRHSSSVDETDTRQLGDNSARIARPGTTLTLVTAGRMLHHCLEASARLEQIDISCEVIDLRYLWPLDYATVAASVRRTNRLAVVHEAPEFCGWGAEIAAWIAGHHLADLDSPIARLGGARAPVPFERGMADAVLPTIDRIERTLRELARS